ncbi:MAG: signal peptidase I [Planctomycetota bacterium]|jgi:signal peptidase I|nr:signal peptidase I [Planctomycetota bacterium]
MAKTGRGAPKPPPAEPASPAGRTDAAAGSEAPRSAWRSGLDFVKTLGGALLIALLIKAYVADVYVIPSGSMETALHGRPDGGDRILCSKLNYFFRPPRRWEVAVFEFPYDAARLYNQPEHLEEFRGQNFVKRLVGLPGETLAIARGDIWTSSGGTRAEFKRQVKPDSVQRGMWLNVCEEDFSDLSLEELARFWRLAGDGISLTKGGPLRLSPENGGSQLSYRPLIPSRTRPNLLEELPGIPDRYVLEQPVQYRCRGGRTGGNPCGSLFVKTHQTQQLRARCPSCGFLNDESAAVFYHRRSGLYQEAPGRAWENPPGTASIHAPQGEDVALRRIDYHLVPDLRVVADLILSEEKSVFCLTLREDGRQAQARFGGDGRVEISLNGRPSRPEARAVAELNPGQPHRVEFYLVEGTARIFVDSESVCLLELPVWEDRRPAPGSLPFASGVSLSAEGGEVAVRKLVLDRDIFYYSGREKAGGERLPGLNSMGEALIDAKSFFPMGDHCPSSFDARSWGPISLSLLRGPTLLIWWPPERAGFLAAP